MDLADAIRTARATRSYTDEQVDRRDIEALVDAARRAGSGHNRQPWQFVASRDRAWLDELASFGDYTTPLEEATAGIVIAVMEAESHYRLEHNVFDCGRASQNMLLTAAARGLGTCPQGIEDRETAAEFLDLPDGFRPLLAFAVGHPAEETATHIEGVPKEEELHHEGREPVSEVLSWVEDSRASEDTE